MLLKADHSIDHPGGYLLLLPPPVVAAAAAAGGGGKGTIANGGIATGALVTLRLWRRIHYRGTVQGNSTVHSNEDLVLSAKMGVYLGFWVHREF